MEGTGEVGEGASWGKVVHYNVALGGVVERFSTNSQAWWKGAECEIRQSCY